MNPEISANNRLVDRIARNRALDPVATAIAVPMRKLLDSAGPLGPVADALHGTQLGHPLHPAVTDVPIGAWSLATLFDALEAAGSARFTPASDLAIGVGLAGGLVALASGWAEWSDTKGDPQRLGARPCDAQRDRLRPLRDLARPPASEAARRRARDGVRGLRVRLDLGVSRRRALVRHATRDEAHERAARAARRLHARSPRRRTERRAREGRARRHPAADLAECEGRRVGDPGSLYASRRATREGFADGCVTCPWHHAQFSLETGCVERGPAVFSLAQFEARVRDGSVEVRPYRFA